MRIATDTGGTFTDLVLEDEHGRTSMFKAATTPEDPVRGILDALALAADSVGRTRRELLAAADEFIHGTTHAINAIVTGRTARTALLVTAGHRDILTLREGGRLDPFDQSAEYPRPFVPRALTFEVDERIIHSGRILRPLDEGGVVARLQSLADAGIESIAVCLLWSTVNAAHELRIGELIEATLPGMPYSLSHRVNATLREYRRASSTAIDAALKPVMSSYLGRLTACLGEEGFRGEVMVLTSAGGMLPASEVALHPVRVINSGPSMAPVAGMTYAALEGSTGPVVVADTGGTTYDISLIRDNEIPVTRELWIGPRFRGLLVGYPSADVQSIGAGGGSVATVDRGGLLRVGPESAGSQPGPACYARGGARATVTDAAVVLGYVDPENFLGGAMPLDAGLARKAIACDIAAPLGLSDEDAAWSVIDVVTENMAQTINDLAMQHGVDPADATLIGGGGAAGMNSVFIARRLGISRLIFPETGAALSAAGALMADMGTEYSASVFATTSRADFGEVDAVIGRLHRECEEFRTRHRAVGLDSVTTFTAEARYQNQVWEVDVALEEPRFDGPGAVDRFRAAFDRVHARLFGFSDPESPVEIIGIRAQVRLPVRRGRDLRLTTAAVNSRRSSRPAVRRVYFGKASWLETRVMQLDDVEIDRRQQGPAIIESSYTTIVIDPDARFLRTASGSVVVWPLRSGET